MVITMTFDKEAMTQWRDMFTDILSQWKESEVSYTGTLGVHQRNITVGENNISITLCGKGDYAIEDEGGKHGTA